MKEIESSAFENCSSLKNVNFQEGISTIKDSTFAGCTSLQSIIIPTSVNYIEKQAFEGCTSLKEVYVLNPQVQIEEDVFKDCPALVKVDTPNGLTKMKTVPVKVFGYEMWLQPTDGDNGMDYDVISNYSTYDIIFTVEGKDYDADDFSKAEDILSQEQLNEYEDIDVKEFFKETGAKRGLLYYFKAWGSFEIKIPEDEEFNPKKAALVIKNFVGLNSTYADFGNKIVCAFAYDGRTYKFEPDYTVGKGSITIWIRPRPKNAEPTDNSPLPEEGQDSGDIDLTAFFGGPY